MYRTQESLSFPIMGTKEDLFISIVSRFCERNRLVKGIYVEQRGSPWSSSVRIVSLTYCPESHEFCQHDGPEDSGHYCRGYNVRPNSHQHSKPIQEKRMTRRLPPRIQTPAPPFKEKWVPPPHMKNRPKQRERRSNAQSRQLCGQLNRRI